MTERKGQNSQLVQGFLAEGLARFFPEPQTKGANRVVRPWWPQLALAAGLGSSAVGAGITLMMDMIKAAR